MAAKPKEVVQETPEPASDHAEGWRPIVGEIVTGELVSVDETDMGYGLYPVLTLRREDGSHIAVHAFHEVLQSELAKRRPAVGATLTITYLGSPEGKRYHRYRVEGGTIDTDRLWGAYRRARGAAANAPASDVGTPEVDDEPTPF